LFGTLFLWELQKLLTKNLPSAGKNDTGKCVEGKKKIHDDESMMKILIHSEQRHGRGPARVQLSLLPLQC
jgi:hypothetical protein